MAHESTRADYQAMWCASSGFGRALRCVRAGAASTQATLTPSPSLSASVRAGVFAAAWILATQSVVQQKVVFADLAVMLQAYGRADCPLAAGNPTEYAAGTRERAMEECLVVCADAHEQTAADRWRGLGAMHNALVPHLFNTVVEEDLGAGPDLAWSPRSPERTSLLPAVPLGGVWDNADTNDGRGRRRLQAAEALSPEDAGARLAAAATTFKSQRGDVLRKMERVARTAAATVLSPGDLRIADVGHDASWGDVEGVEALGVSFVADALDAAADEADFDTDAVFRSAVLGLPSTLGADDVTCYAEYRQLALDALNGDMSLTAYENALAGADECFVKPIAESSLALWKRTLSNADAVAGSRRSLLWPSWDDVVAFAGRDLGGAVGGMHTMFQSGALNAAIAEPSPVGELLVGAFVVGSGAAASAFGSVADTLDKDEEMLLSAFEVGK